MDLRRVISAARKGEPKATDLLLTYCRAHLRGLVTQRYAYLMTPDWDASDAIQESLLEVHRDLATLRGEDEESLQVWLGSVLRHNLVDRHRYLRRKKRQSVSLLPLENARHKGRHIKTNLIADQSSVSSKLVRNERQTRLRAAIAELPEDQAEIIRLRYLDGRSVAEIVERTGRSRGSIAGLLIRGCRALEQFIAPEAF